MTATTVEEQYRLRARLPVYRRRVARALDCVRRALEIGPAYVSFSGGKDSLALFHLACSVRPMPGFFIDSGAETPDTLATVEAMRGLGYEVRVEHPELSIREMCREAAWWGAIPQGQEITWAKSAWKRILLHEPAARIRAMGYPVALMGLRKEENKARSILLSRRGPVYQRQSDGAWIANPLADWEGADVLAYCLVHGLPLSRIYLDPDDTSAERERRRTGTALGTTFASYGRFQDLRRRYPALWAELLAEFPRLSKLA